MSEFFISLSEMVTICTQLGDSLQPHFISLKSVSPKTIVELLYELEGDMIQEVTEDMIQPQKFVFLRYSMLSDVYREEGTWVKLSVAIIL